MGVNNAFHVAPSIGFVDAAVPGVPGHSLHDNELKEIVKPIRPASIKSPQTVKKTAKNLQECKWNCRCKKKEEEGDNNSDITDDDDDNHNKQLETDESEEESDIETDDRDDDCLKVEYVSEHLVPVHGFQGGVSDMNSHYQSHWRRFGCCKM